jgi:hypothetical protein
MDYELVDSDWCFNHYFLFYKSNLKSNEIKLDLIKMGKFKNGDFNLFYEIFGDLNQIKINQYKGLLGKSIDRLILEKNEITLEELINSFKEKNKLVFKSDSAVIGSERRYFYRFMKWIVVNNPNLEYLELHFIHRKSPWYILSYRDKANSVEKIEVCIYQGNENHIGYHNIDNEGIITFSLEKYKRFYQKFMSYDNCYET